VRTCFHDGVGNIPSAGYFVLYYRTGQSTRDTQVLVIKAVKQPLPPVQDSLNHCYQLIKLKWFSNKIVGSNLININTIFNLVFGCQYHNRYMGSSFIIPYYNQQLLTAPFWHHQVGHNATWQILLCQSQPLSPLKGTPAVVSLVLQIFSNKRVKFDMIFYNQDQRGFV